MSTFLGNHDVPRAIGLADDNPIYGAWDGGKDRAWTNQPQLPTDANPFERLAVAYTLLFTSPGLPMIYYGDEYGQPGAGDPDNRRFMQWSGYDANQTFLHDRIAALAKIRKAHDATRRGTRAILGVTHDTMVYEMTSGGDALFVALNRSDTPQTAQGLPSGGYTDLVTGAALSGQVTIPARTALVLTQ
jgi:glycosidase